MLVPKSLLSFVIHLLILQVAWWKYEKKLFSFEKHNCVLKFLGEHLTADRNVLPLGIDNKISLNENQRTTRNIGLQTTPLNQSIPFTIHPLCSHACTTGCIDLSNTHKFQGKKRERETRVKKICYNA